VFSWSERVAVMAGVRIPAGQSLILSGVDWRAYGRFLRLFAERPAFRLTYDRGVLEIMSPLLGHDRDGASWGGSSSR
jgi:hypothetical protein